MKEVSLEVSMLGSLFPWHEENFPEQSYLAGRLFGIKW